MVLKSRHPDYTQHKYSFAPARRLELWDGGLILVPTANTCLLARSRLVGSVHAKQATPVDTATKQLPTGYTACTHINTQQSSDSLPSMQRLPTTSTCFVQHDPAASSCLVCSAQQVFASPRSNQATPSLIRIFLQQALALLNKIPRLPDW
jgi:hypothetical protein